MRKFLFLGILFLTGCIKEQNCYGTNDVIGNRFEHCKKGDVITVLTAMSSQKIQSFADVADGILWKAEVRHYCSFKHPIVFVGETKQSKQGIKFQVYDCIYIGNKREGVFED